MNNKIEKFEDLLVWQEAMALAEKVYAAFNDCRDYGFRDQIQRAAVSIASNISEGFDRQTNKEYIQFLFIAKGSCSELRTQSYLALRLSYLEKERGDQLLEMSRKISAMLYKLIKTRKNNF